MFLIRNTTQIVYVLLYIYHIIYYINDGNIIYIYISYIIYYSYDVRMYWGINYMMCQYDMLRKTSMICRYASILLADIIYAYMIYDTVDTSAFPIISLLE